MRRIDIPGGWAEVREQADLRVKHKHLLRAAHAAAGGAMDKLAPIARQLPDGPLPDDKDAMIALLETLDLDALRSQGYLTFDELCSLQRIEEVAVAVFTMAWSLKAPLPTIATVGDMEDEGVYEAIAAATKKDAAAAMRGVDFDPNPKADENSPIGPPNDSNGHSRDEGGVPSIKQWQTPSASTSSVA